MQVIAHEIDVDWAGRARRGAEHCLTAQGSRDNGVELKLYQMLSRSSGGKKRELGFYIKITSVAGGSISVVFCTILICSWSSVV